MSDPDKTDAQADKGTEQTKSVQDQVNDIVTGITTDDKGKLVMPEGDFDETLEYAAKTEHRRRGTEGAYAHEKTLRKTAESVAQGLEDQIGKQAQFKPSAKQQEELEELLETDPEAWRVKLNEYETEAQLNAREGLSKIKEDAISTVLIKERTEQLNAFNTLHPDANLTPELIAQSVPKMHLDKLENGKMTYAEFLGVANTYVTSGAAVDTDNPDKPIDLSDAPGSSEPGEEDINKQGDIDYDKTIY